jgi:hypothetical protein
LSNKFEHLGTIARNNEGKMCIMRGYINEMAGTKIPDKKVAKPVNGR